MQPTSDVTSQAWTVVHRGRDEALDAAPRTTILTMGTPFSKAEAWEAARETLDRVRDTEVLWVAEGADSTAALAEWRENASKTWFLLGRHDGDKGDDQPRPIVYSYLVPVAPEVATRDALHHDTFGKVLWAAPEVDFQKAIDAWQDATAWEWIALFREEGSSAIQALPMSFYDREGERVAADRVRALHGEDVEILWLARETRDIVRALDNLYEARPDLRPEAQDAPTP